MKIEDADDLLRMIGAVVIALVLVISMTYLSLKGVQNGIIGYLASALLMMASFFFRPAGKTGNGGSNGH